MVEDAEGAIVPATGAPANALAAAEALAPTMLRAHAAD
jgi:hypothetical protein